jgi:hypothetical protein
LICFLRVNFGLHVKGIMQNALINFWASLCFLIKAVRWLNIMASERINVVAYHTEIEILFLDKVLDRINMVRLEYIEVTTELT